MGSTHINPLIIRTVKYVLLWLLLMGTWFILSPFKTSFFIFSGVITSTVATFILYGLNKKLQRPLKHQLRLSILPYMFWLLKEIVISSWDVTKRIWQITPEITPVSDWVPASQASETGLTIYATSITLTPGTVSIYVEPGRIFVHSITEESFASLVEGSMNRKITRSGG